MKICMMTNTFLPHVGGVARSVQTFAEDFRKRRHKVLVVAPTYPGNGKTPARGEKHVVRLPAIQQFNGSDFSVRLPLAWMLDPILQEFKPDIVHSHHPYVLGDSALRYAADKSAPVVFTHHTLHEEYTHNVSLTSSAFKQFVIELCTQYANLCDAVIAPSESIAKLILQRGVTVPVEVIPTGIDVKSFASGRRERFRKAHGLPARAFVVGHLGRLAPEKNLPYLGRAACRFLQKSRNAFFLVVGAGPSEETLREIFAKEKLSDRLVMPGARTGQALFDAYAAMDVFSFSSLTETQGMVLTEAMAAGLPVVALDASGVREVVHDGTNGFLLDAEADEKEFAERLTNIKNDPRLRRRLRAGARRTALSFSRQESARKSLALYERVLRQARRQRPQTDENNLNALRKRLEVEWALVSQKAGAVVKAMTGGEAGRKGS